MFLEGYGPAIIAGLGTTLRISALSLLVACAFGLLGAVAKLSQSRWAQRIAGLYITIIRGVPELVLMLLVFYGGPGALNWVGDQLGLDYIDVDPFLAGTLTLGFIFGAYLTETFRGAILAIPAGQAEAAYAFGMGRGQVLRRVVLPQMVRHALPGFTNTWLVMVKATALVSIIGLDDMVHRAGLAASATRQPFTFYAALGAIYLAITTVSLVLLTVVGRRYNVGVRAVDR